MSYTPKPKIAHPSMKRNDLGMTVRDYEGSMSTLCAGCGHDSVTASIIQAFFELNLPPHAAAKISGIGCSSKTPTYFLDESHGFNSVHGRMPSVATGANAANRHLTYIGISGDGDSLSIGIGQLCHAIRRNVNLLYIIENNGVYGLTKGQFSASADQGSRSKRGEENLLGPIDPTLLAISLNASLVARSFSGDKAQLVPLIKAGLMHPGFALIDVTSPCVAFNNHVGSTKSYSHVRQTFQKVVHADFVPPAKQITASYDEGEITSVALHDGSSLLLHKVEADYDPTDPVAASRYIAERAERGEILTGLLYIDPDRPDMHANEQVVDVPLNSIPFRDLSPGSAVLEKIQARFR